MHIELRDPKKIMKLSRLGSFHQSKLSFLRSFLREFKNWDYKRDMFDLDSSGHGVAIYSLKKSGKIVDNFLFIFSHNFIFFSYLVFPNKTWKQKRKFRK